MVLSAYLSANMLCLRPRYMNRGRKCLLTVKIPYICHIETKSESQAKGMYLIETGHGRSYFCKRNRRDIFLGTQ